MQDYRKYLVLFFPILFMWAGENLHSVKYASDPDYIYLVNAVAICDGKSVGHIDNPGTTVMQIGALTIGMKHLLQNPGNEELVTHVFSEPDRFVKAIQTVILFLNTLILFLLGYVALKKTNSLWGALLLQVSVFISANALDHVWTKLSPEPVLFFVTCAFAIAVLNYYSEKERNFSQHIIIFALIIGAGLGTKATFLPLAIFPLFIFPGVKRKLFYLAGVVASFVLFTIPAIPEYKNMYFWFRNLITHSGKYGGGEKNLIDVKTYVPNILEIVANNPLFAVVLGFGIMVLVFLFIRRIIKKEKNKDSDKVRILAGLTFTSAFGVLLVAKHYHANHYLIPVLLLTGISSIFIISVIIKSVRFQNMIFAAMVVFLLLLTGWNQPPKLRYADYGYRITNEEMDSTNVMIKRDFPNYTHIYYYPYAMNKYTALNFGDVYTKRQMLPELKKLYPGIYFYDFYFDLMQYWNAQINLEDIVEFHGKKILLIGGPRDEKQIEEMANRGFPLNTIYRGRVQAIFELDTVKYSQLTAGKQKIIEKEIVCGAELLTSDNQLYLGTNGESFGIASSRSNETSRSGEYSFKMDENTEYTVEYLLDSLKSGDNFEVEVWRKSDNFSGGLVVAAREAKIFEKAQYDYITTDDSGWNLIRIQFTVPPELENKALLIYFWNAKKKKVYFDDLAIRKFKYQEQQDNKLIVTKE